MPEIDVDPLTYLAIDTTAALMGISHGDVVARLVEQQKSQAATKIASAGSDNDGDQVTMVGVYADYDGRRTHGFFDTETHRIDITDDPLAGNYKTPSNAARAVIAHYNPRVNSNRNGWDFWILDDGTGRTLQAIRYNGGPAPLAVANA